MKRKILFLGLISGISSLLINAQEIDPGQVKQYMKRVADWQIVHFRNCYSGQDKPHHFRDWTSAALYVGMVKWAEIADDDTYYNWLKSIGEEQEWTLHRRTYHADDHAVGQMYLELFRKYGDTAMMTGAKERFDYILAHPSTQPITLDNYKHLERWTWCDALFMAPPVLAKLAKITCDSSYTAFMMEEYKATTEHLFDPDENLYYRDNSYIGKLAHDRKIFWSRGNGWVFAGLTLILNEYDPKSPEYEYFLDIYKKMADKLISIQTPQGHWAMSLLSQDAYPTPETSGTSFFTYGLAWGINNGILKRKNYEPAVKKGWNALVSHITEEGMLGYVQPIGAAPGMAWPDKSEVYGSGAFLSAGSEVFKLYSEN